MSSKIIMISKYISYEEATKSQAAIRHHIINEPNSQQLHNMMVVGEKIHTPVREHFKKPIPVSSFFRCEKLNSIIGGSPTSQHKTGEALDMDVDGIVGLSNWQIFQFIKLNLDFDQLIWEYGNKINPAWVHASYSERKNRREVLYIGHK
jgi:hypothetical protein